MEVNICVHNQAWAEDRLAMGNIAVNSPKI